MENPLVRKIVYISEGNECENCLHRFVCSFKEDREKILKNLKESLDREDDVPNSIFNFNFHCNEFHEKIHEKKW